MVTNVSDVVVKYNRWGWSPTNVMEENSEKTNMEFIDLKSAALQVTIGMWTPLFFYWIIERTKKYLNVSYHNTTMHYTFPSKEHKTKVVISYVPICCISPSFLGFYCTGTKNVNGNLVDICLTCPVYIRCISISEDKNDSWCYQAYHKGDNMKLCRCSTGKGYYAGRLKLQYQDKICRLYWRWSSIQFQRNLKY